MLKIENAEGREKDDAEKREQLVAPLHQPVLRGCRLLSIPRSGNDLSEFPNLASKFDDAVLVQPIRHRECLRMIGDRNVLVSKSCGRFRHLAKRLTEQRCGDHGGASQDQAGQSSTRDRTGAAVMADWKKTDPAQRKEAETKMQGEWKKWMNDHSKMFADVGAGVGKTKLVTIEGTSDSKNDIMLYCIVEAESHETAAKSFEGHPHLQIPQSSIEIMEIHPLPGMR